MFLGVGTSKVDSHGRIFIFSKFRSEINEPLIISRIHEGYLTLMLESEFKTITNEIKQEGKTREEMKKTNRFIYSKCEKVRMDSQGRILIPKKFVQHAQLSQNVVQIGRENKIELWDEVKLQEYESEQKGIKL